MSLRSLKRSPRSPRSPERMDRSMEKPRRDREFITFPALTLFRAGKPGNPVFLTNFKSAQRYKTQRGPKIMTNKREIKLVDLTKVENLNDITIELNDGELFCILNENKERITSEEETAKKEREYYNKLLKEDTLLEDAIGDAAIGFYTPASQYHHEEVIFPSELAENYIVHYHTRNILSKRKRNTRNRNDGLGRRLRF